MRDVLLKVCLDVMNKCERFNKDGRPGCKCCQVGISVTTVVLESWYVVDGLSYLFEPFRDIIKIELCHMFQSFLHVFLNLMNVTEALLEVGKLLLFSDAPDYAFEDLSVHSERTHIEGLRVYRR
jgi:hypothetical protein